MEITQDAVDAYFAFQQECKNCLFRAIADKHGPDTQIVVKNFQISKPGAENDAYASMEYLIRDSLYVHEVTLNLPCSSNWTSVTKPGEIYHDMSPIVHPLLSTAVKLLIRTVKD